MKLIGIDPGVRGALATLDPVVGTLDVIDMPTLNLTKERRSLDPFELANYFDQFSDEKVMCFIEMSWPRQEDGSASAFTFGMNYGIALMGAAANFIRIEKVSPQKWKRAMGIPAGAGKDGSRGRASQLMPRHAHFWPLKKHDGRAEAALIACWGAWQIEKGLISP